MCIYIYVCIYIYAWVCVCVILSKGVYLPPPSTWFISSEMIEKVSLNTVTSAVVFDPLLYL